MLCPCNFKGYYIWIFYLKYFPPKRLLFLSWFPMWETLYRLLYNSLPQSLISHVKLSKSFMKIEVHYIHFSYLSQCIIFKQPSKLVKHKLPCKIHVRNRTTLSSAFILLPIFHDCLCNQYWTHRAIVSWLACLLSSLIHDSLLIQKDFVDVILYIYTGIFFCL